MARRQFFKIEFLWEPTMNRQLFRWRKMAFVTCVGLLGSTPAFAQLKPGDKAPDFKLRGSDGKTHQLADYVGKQAVVIAWYPKAFTGG